MQNTQRFQNFSEFWPYYLGQHRLKVCRAWHYLGTVASCLLLIYLIIAQQWGWLWVVLLVGYGPAWIGHFVFEKNRPATFRYPLWSLRGDFTLLYFALSGKIEEELRMHLTQHPTSLSKKP